MKFLRYLPNLIIYLIVSEYAHAESNFSISPGLMYFHYEEFKDGSTFNKEIGFLPGITFNLQNSQHSAGAHLFDGTVEYDGFLQTTTNQLIPFETTTSESLYYFFYRYDFTKPNTDFNYFMSLNYQIWERFIQPTATVNSSLYEEYRWWHIEAGVKIERSIKQNLKYKIELAGLRTFNGTILVDLEDLGIGSPRLNLGDKFGLRCLVSMDLKTDQHSTTSIGVEYKYWGFGKSNEIDLTNGTLVFEGLHEPESKSNLLRFFVQFTQSF